MRFFLTGREARGGRSPASIKGKTTGFGQADDKLERDEVRHVRYHRDHILGQFRRLFRTLFPERQIFFRSRGEVRFLRLAPAVQAATAGALVAMMFWTIGATVAVLGRDDLLLAKEREAAHATRELGALMSELARLEDEAIARTEALEARQAVIERIAGPYPKDGEVAIPYLPAIADEPEDMAEPAREPNKGAFLTLPEGRGLIGTMIGAGSATAAPHASGRAAQRLDRLLVRLADIERRQMHTALAFADVQAAEVDERRAVLARLGMSLENLVGADRLAATAMGGPYIAETPQTPDAAFDLLVKRADTRMAVDRILLSMPSTVPAVNYYISSGFGRRIDPFHKTRAMHSGLDMAGWTGEPILAAGAGKVVKSGRAPAYGNMIEIDHGNGFKTRYGHMRKLFVKVGETVTAGQKIGEMGASGRATSTHLHYEIWFRGKLLDPQPFIEASQDVHALQQEAGRYHEKG